MNVAICMLNAKYIHSSLAPWCLRAGVKAYCDERIVPIVAEGTVNEPEDRIVDRLITLKPDVIGFCCYIWNIDRVKSVAKKISQTSDAVIVFGGPEVSYNASQVLAECSFVSAVLSGEGEEPFAFLCSAIFSGGDISSVSGVCCRQDGKMHMAEPFVSGKEPVSPYCKDYFDTLRGRIAYIETSRGCPFSCAFCLSGRCGSLIFFDTERVKREILALANSGTQTVKFIDRTFNAKPSRANEIISYIIEKRASGEIPEGVCFHFEIDGGTLREDTLNLLCSAPTGLFQLEVGLQSFNPETLKAVNRNPDTTRLTAIIKRLLSAGNMHIHVDLIAGLPKEDLASFAKSFDTLYGMKPHMLQLGFLKLLHGSKLRDEAADFSCVYDDDAPYEVIQTDCLSEFDMKIIHDAENALDRLYNSGRFPRTLDYLIEDCGFSPFQIFSDFGAVTSEKANIPLDEYLTLVYNFFSDKADSTVLRDRMVCDRLASNSSGTLPACLRIEDKRLKRVKKYINENLRRKAGKIACAMLYTENKIVYCDYTAPRNVTGNYPLHFIDSEVTDL